MITSAKRLALSIAIIAIATIWMLDSTWMTWPDAIYDFGSQLYYPWQMTAGKHLYTDIAYFNGPLSQYFNAAMFAIFGVSLRTLIWVNFAIVICVIALIHRIVSWLSDTLAATFTCLVFIVVFAFSQYVGIGNFNWMCPYTHEVTHGVAFSLAMIAAMGAFMKTGRQFWMIVSGTLLGLIFLTKAEVLVPAAAAAVLGLLLWRPAVGKTGLFRFIASFMLVIAIGFILIASTIGIRIATRAILGSWPWVFDRRIAQLQFYRQGLGIDDFPGNLWKILVIGSVSCAIAGTIFASGMMPKRWRSMTVILLAGELIGICWFWRFTLQIARPWPVFVAIITGISIKRAWQQKQSDQWRWVLRATLSLFALGLMGKMLFNARIWQYGFALAMPAAVILVEAVIGWIPHEISLHGGSGTRCRWAGIAALICVTFCIVANQYRGPAVAVGQGSDQFFARVRGDEVNNALRMNNLLPEKATLAVMPQGLMLNYLTGRVNSIACVNLMPPEVLSIGEDHIGEQLNAHPPDIIILSEKDIRDGAFVLTEGDYHYGQKILAWVLSHYHRVIPANPTSELKLSFWLRNR